MTRPDPTTARIIRNTAGYLFAVAPCYDHAYAALPVKRVAGGFVAKAGQDVRLERIAASTIVREAV